MRRVAVVAAAREPEAGLAATRRWLATLPSGGVTWAERVADVALERIDVLWLRGAATPDTRLLAWMRAGGRVLGTHDGVLLAVALGLADEEPGLVQRAGGTPDLHDSAGIGLAGFGPHPLYAGLRDGALLALRGRVPDTWRCYSSRWPGESGVVGVERHGLEVHADRILAWEYAVGTGGMLCLGLAPALAHESFEAPADDSSILLANALLGEAIPHADRPPPVSLWPRPGRRATAALEGGAGPEPGLVAGRDEWPGSVLPRLDLPPAAEWTQAGRRVLVTARGAQAGPAARAAAPTLQGSASLVVRGRREVWAPPFRVMYDAGIRDAIPGAPAHLAADEVAGGLALRGYRLLERWVAAAEAPAVAWEVGGQDGIEVVAEWSVDLRRAWPYPAGCYGDLAYAVAADGRSLSVEAVGGPLVRFAVAGGTLDARGADDSPTIRVTCSGTTPLRLVAAAGTDAIELGRAVRALEGGAQGLAAARARKASQLERHGTAFEAPDPQLGRGFAWARQRGDEALVGAAGIGRSMLSACPREAGEGAWCFGTKACGAAAAQLIAGNRDPAREVLKFLAQSQHPDGGIASHYPLGGLVPAPDAAGTIAFLQLAERLLAWTGDAEPFRRFDAALIAALRYLARRPASEAGPEARVLDALEPLAAGSEATAALATLRLRASAERPAPATEPHAVVEAAAAALRRAPGALPGSGAGPALLEAVASLWGLEPAASEASLTLAPLLPVGWERFALRGLRIGRSVLDLEIRRRPHVVVLRTTHRFGPSLVLTAGVRGAAVEAAEVDDVTLPAGRARFQAHARHEVRFHLAE